jgi:hypothetical protein
MMSLILAVILLAGVGSAAGQTENPSVHNLTIENCTESDLEKAILFAPRKNITANSPGRMTGYFKLGSEEQCPLVIEVSIKTPSGLLIQDENSEFRSWGEGPLPGAKFTLNPNNQTQKIISTEVFSSKTGTHTVEAQIEYWPEDRPELAQSITTNFTFYVEEPMEQYVTSESSTSQSPQFPLTQMIFLVGFLAIVVIWISPRIKIK